MLWERRERAFRTHQTVASVATRLAVTLPDLKVTVNPGEARRTGAGVAALARIHTRGTIGTRFVVCAVVQICKKKQPNKKKTQLNLYLQQHRGLYKHRSPGGPAHLGYRRCLPSPPCRCTATVHYKYHVYRMDGVYTHHKRHPAILLCICSNKIGES